MAWVTPVVKGATPPGVGGCAAVVVGDLCLFIGGADRTPRGFFDVWALRLGGSAGGDASSSSDASASVHLDFWGASTRPFPELVGELEKIGR